MTKEEMWKSLAAFYAAETARRSELAALETHEQALERRQLLWRALGAREIAKLLEVIASDLRQDEPTLARTIAEAAEIVRLYG